jgi:hypothetical protein
VFSWSRRIVCAYGLFQKGSPLETMLPSFIILRGRAGYSRDSRAEKGRGGGERKKEDTEKKKQEPRGRRPPSPPWHGPRIFGGSHSKCPPP